MKIQYTLILLCFCFSLAAQTDKTNQINTVLAQFPLDTEFSIACLDGNEVNYYGGVKGKEGVNIQENKNDLFEIGSITKVFTSNLLATAILENKCTPETKVSKIIGLPLNQNLEISLVELSNHTSGLARIPENGLSVMGATPNNPYMNYTDSMLLDYMTKYAYCTKQGQESQYSNLGAGLLGHCIAKLYGSSYCDLLQNQIFNPLLMKSSGCDHRNLKGRLVVGQDKDGNKVANWDFQSLAGAGAIKSTVADMTKYAKAIIAGENDALSLQQKITFKVNEYLSMGMGWHIIHAKDGRNLLWHNGATGGYHSQMIVDIENQKSVIILTNVNLSHPKSNTVEELAFSLIK